MSPRPDPGAVAAAIDAVCDPCSVAAGAPLSLRAMGLVRECRVDGDAVTVAIGVTGPGCTFAGLLLRAVEDAVRAVPGVRRATVRLDPDFVWDPDLVSGEAARVLARRRERTLALTAVRPRQWEERAP